MDIQRYIDKMKTIQNYILDYIDNNDNIEEKYQNLSKIFSDIEISANKYKLKSVLYLIHKISKYHFRSPDFFAKITLFLLNFSKDIKNFFTNSEIFDIFKNNKLMILILIKEKILEIDQSIASIMQKEKYKKRKYNDFFYPEIINFIQDEEIANNNKTIKFFEENRKVGENNSNFLQIIRKDLIDKFISYVDKNAPNLDGVVKSSIFETNSILLQRRATLIEYASFFGSVQIFKYLQSHGIQLKSSLWPYAIHGRNIEIIQSLINNNIKPIDDNYKNCAIEAIKCHNNDICEFIKNNFFQNQLFQDKLICSTSIKYYNYFYFGHEFYSKNLFIDLCTYDHYLIVEEILKNKNFNPNFKTKPISNNYTGIFTPLYISILNNNADIVKLLLNRPDINVNCSIIKNVWNDYEHELTALNLAVMNNNVEIVKLLLAHKDIDVNVKSIHKKYLLNHDIKVTENLPITIAINNQNVEIVELLSSHKSINVNLFVDTYNSIPVDELELNRKQIAPLYAAVKKNNIAIVKLLLHIPNIDVNIKSRIYVDNNNIEETALNNAIKNRFKGIVQILLLRTDIDVNIASFSSTIIDLNEDSYGRETIIRTPLFAAAITKDADIVKLLLENDSIDVNAESKYELEKYSSDVLYSMQKNRQTALHLAIFSNIPRIFDILVKCKKIDVSAKFHKILRDKNSSDIEEKSPLIFAVEHGNMNMIKRLLENPKTDVNYLSITRKKNDSEVIKRNALHIAFENKNTEIIDLLLKNPKIDLNIKSIMQINQKNLIQKTEKTILHYAILYKNKSILTSILSNPKIDFNLKTTTCKSSPNTFFEEELTPCKIAIDLNDDQIFKIIFEYTMANFNSIDINWKELIYSAKSEKIKELIYNAI